MAATYFLALGALILSSAVALPAHNHNARIIGGADTFAGEFGYAAAITLHTSQGNFFCGGALVSADFVLTAAVCVDGADSFTVVLGSHARNGDADGALILTTDESLVHPGYDPNTLRNNVGLIRLQQSVPATPQHYEIELERRTVDPFTTLLFAGWGVEHETDQHLAPVLKRAILITLSNVDCEWYYGSQILESMMCAQGVFNEGPCYGDVGGPLVERLSDPLGGTYRDVLVGVSSFHSGNGCDTTEPSGYTRIAHVYGWIEYVIGGGWSTVGPESTTESSTETTSDCPDCWTSTIISVN